MRPELRPLLIDACEQLERLQDIIVRAKRIAETEQASMTLQVLDEA